jgi:hypothetical protein
MTADRLPRDRHHPGVSALVTARSGVLRSPYYRRAKKCAPGVGSTRRAPGGTELVRHELNEAPALAALSVCRRTPALNTTRRRPRPRIHIFGRTGASKLCASHRCGPDESRPRAAARAAGVPPEPLPRHVDVRSKRGPRRRGQLPDLTRCGRPRPWCARPALAGQLHGSRLIPSSWSAIPPGVVVTGWGRPPCPRSEAPRGAVLHVSLLAAAPAECGWQV